MPRATKATAADGTAEAATETLPPALLDEALRLWGDAMNVNIGGRIEHWERHGLTTGQLRLMTRLQDAGEPMPLGELAQILGVSPATITGITTRLVQRRLIKRLPDPSDRRVIKVVLTEEGERAIKAVTGPARVFYTRLFTGLGQKRTEQLLSILAEWIALAESLKQQQAISENGARSAGSARPSRAVSGRGQSP